MTTIAGDRLRQLPLGLRLRDSSAFENFLPGRNSEIVERCRKLARLGRANPRDWVFLWGDTGCGKTHLMEAVCREAGETGGSPIYLPLREIRSESESVLDGIEVNRPVCIDDVDAIAGDAAWEQGLFGLYERLRSTSGTMIVAGRVNPATLRFGLRDLATRLGAGLVYHLQPLTDNEKISALRLRAARRGFDLGDDVGRYLLGRFARDTHSLFSLLDRLDHVTLAAQRRLTIPFLKSLE